MKSPSIVFEGASAHVLLLGAGAVGQEFLKMKKAKTTPTRRTESPDSLAWVRFDVSNKETWHALPEGVTHVVQTFASCAKTLAFQEYFRREKASSPGLPWLVCSSTSSYVTTGCGMNVDEQFPIDLSQERFAIEEEMRQKNHSVVLALAGLFGGVRDPAGWVRKGLIRNADAFVNLISHRDVARALWWAVEHAEVLAGERFNLCTQTYVWSDLLCDFVKLGRVTPVQAAHVPCLGPSVLSKQVNAQKWAKISGMFREKDADSVLDARVFV
jgi:nucleoside-diphosphate-sugar epimerase